MPGSNGELAFAVRLGTPSKVATELEVSLINEGLITLSPG
jgi:hypothetical protein